MHRRSALLMSAGLRHPFEETKTPPSSSPPSDSEEICVAPTDEKGEALPLTAKYGLMVGEISLRSLSDPVRVIASSGRRRTLETTMGVICRQSSKSAKPENYVGLMKLYMGRQNSEQRLCYSRAKESKSLLYRI